ncbi:hypothetical protein BESB_049420 [Besnoitia besnoiti]|uniref:Nucleolar protein 9 n=1 Tax=Besnoitia besnoiti TaxID=94643 RepID=A0A2A9MMF8_BESBE|nr:hypothetical protein BESB_049420 [Besnoitia besnoiti]PFH36750.1 hypothetical protein BESB_049420 [Besnoitia besnoiti]
MAKNKRRGGRRHKKKDEEGLLAAEGDAEPQDAQELGEVDGEAEEEEPAEEEARAGEPQAAPEGGERPGGEDAFSASRGRPAPRLFQERRREGEGLRRGGKGAVDGYLEYLSHVKEVIDSKAFKSPEEWEAFVAATAEEVASKTPLVLTDQRCSKIIEKILGLLASFLLPAAATGEEKRHRELRVVEAFLLLLRKISGMAGQLAVHANGSHVLQTLLGGLPCVIDAERRLKQEGDEEKAAQSVEDLSLYCLHSVESENGGWVSLMSHSSGSHVFRAVVRAAAGIYSLPSVEELGRRKPRKTRHESVESLPVLALASAEVKDTNSALLFPASPSLQALLKIISKEVCAALSADPYSLLFDAYASPALQLLLQVTTQAPQLQKARRRLLTAIFRLDATEESRRAEMIQLADALVESPTGSRVLEVAAPLLSPEEFQVFFSTWVLKRADSLAQGRFGNFVLQKLLASPLLQAVHVRQLVSALDFQGCLGAGTPAVLWRLSEACRRVRDCQSAFTKRLFAALRLAQNPQHISFAWFALLALRPPEDLPASFCPFAKADDADEGEAAEKKQPSLRHLTEMLTPTGVSILLNLLRFEPAAIQPLVAGFKKFLKILKKTTVAVRQWRGKDLPPLWEQRPVLLRLACDAQGSRLLEGVARTVTRRAAAKETGASKRSAEETGDAEKSDLFPPQAIQQLLRAFSGSYAPAALHATGGFVVTTFYDIATVDMKRRIVKELLEVEDELREKNYTAYVKCEIYKFKRDEDSWAMRQEKKSKTREIFKDLLAEDEEAAAAQTNLTAEEEEEKQKEKKRQEKLAAADHAAWAFIEGDSVAKQLLGTGNGKKEKREKKKGKRASGAGSDDESGLLAEGGVADEATQAIDELFGGSERSTKKRHQSARKKADSAVEESSEAAPDAAEGAPRREKKRDEKGDAEESGEAAQADKALEAALFFIEGTRKDLSKRQLAKRRKLEASKLATACASLPVH